MTTALSIDNATIVGHLLPALLLIEPPSCKERNDDAALESVWSSWPSASLASKGVDSSEVTEEDCKRFARDDELDLCDRGRSSLSGAGPRRGDAALSDIAEEIFHLNWM